MCLELVFCFMLFRGRDHLSKGRTSAYVRSSNVIPLKILKMKDLMHSRSSAHAIANNRFCGMRLKIYTA